MSESKTFFITGASKGFGLLLTNKLLKRGFNVVSTSRAKEQLIQSVDSKYATEENFLALEVDISNRESILQAINETINKFKRIDVLINNAGFSQVGSFEELTDQEIKDIFDCNVFGVMNVTRLALPHLRANKKFEDGPRIINISSIGGINGQITGVGTYISTKFAVDGFSEALAQEVKEFGIHVTIVNPGSFRTEFTSKGSIKTASNPIPEYTAVRQVESYIKNMYQTEQGNPEKACDVIIDVAAVGSNPPLHLLLGTDALHLAKIKIESLEKDIERFKEITASTDYTN